MNILPLLRSIFCTLLIASTAMATAHAATQKEREIQGAKLFRDKGCTYCHGPQAKGTERGPSLDDVSKTMKPIQIANQIKNGGQKMPPFKESLSEQEVNHLVQFLRAKHRPALPTPDQPSAQ